MAKELFSECEIPHFQESLGGSLIDAARISVMGAMALLPAPDVPRIILPNTADQMADDAAASVHGCLEQAMEWLNAARAFTMEQMAAQGHPPTSFHHVSSPTRKETA